MILAVAVAIWFVVSGVADLASRPVAGRRALTIEPRWLLVSRRIRGVLSILGGLAAAAGGAIALLGLRLPFPGLSVNLVLAGLAAWTVVDCARPPIRLVRLVLGILGFTLAVFAAGFRG